MGGSASGSTAFSALPSGGGNIAGPAPTGALASGKGGRSGGSAGKGGQTAQTVAPTTPTAPAPTQGQYAPLTPQGNFNVNQAAAGGLQQAMQGTQAAMGYQPMQVRPTDYNAAQAGSQGYNAAQAGSQGYNATQAGSQGYNATQAQQQARLSADQVRAGQIAGTDLGAYTNPYESQVVQQSLSDLERSRLMQQDQLSAQATAAKAFGGSRQGIAEAETNRAFAEQAARTSSGLRQSGYQQAQALAGQDIAAQMQAAMSNQQANLQAGTTSAQLAQQVNLQNMAAANQAAQFGAGAANVAGLQNMAAANQASQFGAGAANVAGLQNMAATNQAAQFGAGAANVAGLQNTAATNAQRQYGATQAMTAQQLNQNAGLQGAQMRMNAASQMGGLGQQAFNTGRTISQDQMQQGLMQQGLQQSLIDAARGQYQGFTGAPQQSLGLPLAALGATPNQSTTTKSKNPGLFDYLSLGLMASDIRLKKDIKLLGNENGHNIYSWEWTDEGKRIADPSQPKVGVMAQELQETHPHLVELGPDGFLRVDYSGLAAEAA